MTKFKGTIQSNVILQKLYLKILCSYKDSEQGNDNNDTEMSQ